MLSDMSAEATAPGARVWAAAQAWHGATAVFGPRPRIAGRTVWVSALVPIAWLAYTLVRGEVTGWYPYPFVDAEDHGYGRVLLNCAGVATLYLACAGLALLNDRRLPPAPAEG
jgi:hypothetical protein